MTNCSCINLSYNKKLQNNHTLKTVLIYTNFHTKQQNKSHFKKVLIYTGHKIKLQTVTVGTTCSHYKSNKEHEVIHFFFWA